jgi:signal recognition particle subunit SRP54
MGNLKGMIEMIKEVVPDNQAEVAKRLQEGKFSLRDMYEQFQNMMKMGPLNKGTFSLRALLRTTLTRVQ